MIQNLNKFTFAAFGQILPESSPTRGFPETPEWKTDVSEYREDLVWAYRAENEPTFLDIERGMAVLAVSRPEEALEYFYLDKPVRINPGIRFAIIPRKDCAVRRALHESGAWTPLYTLDAGALRLNITNRIEVRDIYTLFYQEKENGFFFKGEAHDLLELVYVDKGALHNVVDGTDTVLTQGELMIYGPGLWHMQYADVNVEVSFITVSFQLEERASVGALGKIVNRRFGLDAEGTLLLRRMLEEREKNDDTSGDMILCLLKLLLLTLLRSVGGGEQRLRTPAALHSENRIVNSALSYISANVYQKLSVPLVAQSCAVSPSRLTALFQQRLSITPGEYIRRVKLEESKTLIRRGERNFSEVAALLNYSTAQQFSRQFKQKFGVSPSEYAKSVR